MKKLRKTISVLFVTAITLIVFTSTSSITFADMSEYTNIQVIDSIRDFQRG